MTNKALAYHLMETLATVKQQSEDIATIKRELSATTQAVGHLELAQQRTTERVTEIEKKLRINHNSLCSNRQRESMGNFILSGEHIQAYQQNENFYELMANGLWQKYGIYVTLDELNFFIS